MQGDERTATWFGLAGGILGLLFMILLRRQGLWVNDQGVRLCTGVRSWTFRWDTIRRFEIVGRPMLGQATPVLQIVSDPPNEHPDFAIRAPGRSFFDRAWQTQGSIDPENQRALIEHLEHLRGAAVGA